MGVGDLIQPTDREPNRLSKSASSLTVYSLVVCLVRCSLRRLEYVRRDGLLVNVEAHRKACFEEKPCQPSNCYVFTADDNPYLPRAVEHFFFKQKTAYEI